MEQRMKLSKNVVSDGACVSLIPWGALGHELYPRTAAL